MSHRPPFKQLPSKVSLFFVQQETFSFGRNYFSSRKQEPPLSWGAAGQLRKDSERQSTVEDSYSIPPSLPFSVDTCPVDYNTRKILKSSRWAVISTKPVPRSLSSSLPHPLSSHSSSSCPDHLSPFPPTPQAKSSKKVRAAWRQDRRVPWTPAQLPDWPWCPETFHRSLGALCMRKWL